MGSTPPCPCPKYTKEGPYQDRPTAVPLPPVTPADLLLINDCIAQTPRFQIQKYRK